MSSLDPNRRLHPRYTAPYRVVVSADEALQLSAMTDDLSATGLFLATPHDLPLEQSLDLTIHLPDGQRAIRCQGRIMRRSRPEQEGRVGYGVLLSFDVPAFALDYIHRIDALREGAVEVAPEDYTVLLIEDNEVVRELVAKSLPEFWLRRYPSGPALTVECAAEHTALKRIAVGRFRLVISALIASSDEGQTFVRAIRETSSVGSIPVLAVGSQAQAEEAMAMDADAFLARPLRMKELFPAVHMLLAGRLAPVDQAEAPSSPSPLEKALRDLTS